MSKILSRPVISWALYDWANSAFAIVVLAGFFPVFFRDYWAAGQQSSQITFYLGIANSLSSLAIVLSAPLLGAIGDRGGLRKQLLVMFAMMGMLVTAALYWVPQGGWGMALAFFALGSTGFMAANVFYDALLVTVSDEARFDQVSALGYSLGYLGSGLLFAFCVYLTLHPDILGLKSAAEAVRTSFLLTAVWWGIFTLPLLLWVKEERIHTSEAMSTTIRAGYAQLASTVRRIRTLRPVWMFLIAYWLYIDGVDTVIRMAVDYGKALGFDSNQLITALLITQFVGFPAAIAFGWIGSKIGSRNGILIGIVSYCLITIWASTMDSANEFYGLAISVGLVQGGIQSLSRAYYARLIPTGESGEFFGFYNMLGKFATVLGPLMVGWTGVLTGNPRIGLLSLLVLFVAGGIMLWLAPQPDESPKN